MKVVLLTEVKNVGKANQVVEVSDGYAANFLFAKKLAIPASKQALVKNAEIKKNEIFQEQEKIKNYQKIASDLALHVLEFTLKTRDHKVTNAISAKQICAYLEDKYQITIDKHKFVGFKPINKIGISVISVKLYTNVIAKIKINITES